MNHGIKLYEYLGAKRPIVVWGQGSYEAAGLVEEAGAGVACGLDAGKLVEALDEMKRDPAQFARTSRERFNRRCQARWLADRLESFI